MEANNNLDFEKKISEFRSYYDDNYDFLVSASNIFKNLISALLVGKVTIEGISTRIKDREECISKFKRTYLTELENGNR